MEKGQNQNKISYIRKPLARRGKMSLLLAAIALLADLIVRSREHP